MYDEVSNEKKSIFFETTEEYGEYIVSENYDAFLLAAILPAIVSGQNVTIKGSISDTAYVNYKTLIYLLCKTFNRPIIEILPEKVESFVFNGREVGTGFSGGIDSFATYLNFTKEECPESYRITHLALFNVGAYGNEYEKTKAAFEKDLIRAKEFASLVNKPLVVLNSNITELSNGYEELFNFTPRLTTALSSAVIVLQKLFGKYIVSSGGLIDETKLNKQVITDFENLLLPLISNRNTEMFISESDLNRVQKTKIVSDNTITYGNLYVCSSDSHNEKHGFNFQKNGYLNCSECIKCTRTLITLDFLGCLDKYRNLFDLNKYYKQRDALIMNIYLWKNINLFQRDIFNLMQSTGYVLPTELEEQIKQKQIDEEFIKLQSKYKKL